MDVTDVLRDRMAEPAGLQRMAVVSLAVHVCVAAAIIMAPSQWMSHTVEAPREVMSISLGGGNGPSNGGMTAMGGRPVQVETPPDDVKRPEAVRPPAAKAPEMTVPKDSKPQTKAAASPTVTQAPDEARGRTPTKGAKAEAGSAVAVTGAKGQGFGLSTGGGPGAGATLDVADFCCPDYLVLMTERVKAAWNQNQGVRGRTIVKFTIMRDGTLADYSVESSSGQQALDLAALRAIVVTRQIPPLPAQFPNPTLTVHLNFEYQR